MPTVVVLTPCRALRLVPAEIDRIAAAGVGTAAGGASHPVERADAGRGLRDRVGGDGPASRKVGVGARLQRRDRPGHLLPAASVAP